MYPARVPPIEAQAKSKGAKELWPPTGDRLANLLTNGGPGPRTPACLQPPPTPHRDLTRGRREEGVGGTYLADPGGGSLGRDLIGSGGNIPAEQNSLI